MIGLNCTAIALKYVLCYHDFSQNATYASFPSWIVSFFLFFVEAIRSMNQMQFVDENIEEINRRIFKDVTWVFMY